MPSGPGKDLHPIPSSQGANLQAVLMTNRMRITTIVIALMAICFVVWQSGEVRSARLNSASINEPIEPGAVANGLRYEYFEIDSSLESQIPVKTGTVGNFDVSLHERSHNIAFRFSGYLLIEQSATYSFTVTSGDFVRLVIGGSTVVNLNPDRDGESQTGTISLEEGYHALILDYSRITGEETPAIGVEWSSISLGQQPVPDAVLFYDDLTEAATPTSTPTRTPISGGTTILLPTSTPTPRSTTDQRVYFPSVPLPVPSNPRIFFTNLSNGAKVVSPFPVKLSAADFIIEPAGIARNGAGHFHLMIDSPCVEPSQQIPDDSKHRHLGSGAKEIILDLAPGGYTLCLQIGDGAHVALDITREIVIEVHNPDRDARIYFSQPANGTVVNGPVDVQMRAEHFIIEPSGGVAPGHGHFHIIINEPCVPPGETIARNETHLHFGSGQAETTLDLAPGSYTLCLQAGNGIHQALEFTDMVSITVQLESQP